jgi:hypothetical protein
MGDESDGRGADGRIRKGSRLGEATRFRPGHTPANKGRRGGRPTPAAPEAEAEAGERPPWLGEGEHISMDEAFLRDWEAYGPQTVVRLRREKPEAWLKRVDALKRHGRSLAARVREWELDAVLARVREGMDADEHWFKAWYAEREAERARTGREPFSVLLTRLQLDEKLEAAADREEAEAQADLDAAVEEEVERRLAELEAEEDAAEEA